MSPNSIALASVIVTGATAIVAVGVTGLSGWRDRAHQKAMADTERKQARLAEAYVALLDHVAKVSYWAQKLRPVVDTNPPQPLPPVPDFDASAAVMARVDAYGSDRVTELTHEWDAAVKAIMRADFLVGMRRKLLDEHPIQPGSPREEWHDWMTPWHELDSVLKPAEVAAREALKDQVAAELK